MDASDRKLLSAVRREQRIAALRDGVQQRAHRIPAKRGRGSYARKPKHTNDKREDNA